VLDLDKMTRMQTRGSRHTFSESTGVSVDALNRCCGSSAWRLAWLYLLLKLTSFL
jgi:hypothetical protein